MRQPLVWVDRNDDIGNTGIGLGIAVALFQVVKNGRLREPERKGERQKLKQSIL
jgi:hypothetical protein